jgi:DNA polymerase
MGVHTVFDRQMLENALDWWREAGVDTLVGDAPHDWFAAPPPRSPVPVDAPAPDAAMPGEWEAFAAWRAGPHAPDAAWLGDGVLASGPIDAGVMILTDLPDREDCAQGTLLTGEPGRLFDRMLHAIGLSRDTVHLVSVCAKRPTGGRVGRSDEPRLGEVALHHLSIARPKRVLLLGDAASRVLLGTEVPRARGRLHPVSHRSGTSEAVASFHPRYLLEHPGRKREAWADLQLLKRGLDR